MQETELMEEGWEVEELALGSWVEGRCERWIDINVLSDVVLSMGLDTLSFLLILEVWVLQLGR